MADYDLQYQDTYIDTLLATANELKNAGYIYKGVATPSTNPGTPTDRVAYLASEPGTYTNFGGIVIASGLYSLTYAGGTWTGTQMQAGSDIDVVQTTGQSTSNVMSQKAVTDEVTIREDSGFNPINETPESSIFLSLTLGNHSIEAKLLQNLSSARQCAIPYTLLQSGKKYILSFDYVSAFDFNVTIRKTDNVVMIASGRQSAGSGNVSVSGTLDADSVYIGVVAYNGSTNQKLELTNFYIYEESSVKAEIERISEEINDVVDSGFNPINFAQYPSNLECVSINVADKGFTASVIAQKGTSTTNYVAGIGCGGLLYAGKTYLIELDYVSGWAGTFQLRDASYAVDGATFGQYTIGTGHISVIKKLEHDAASFTFSLPQNTAVGKTMVVSNFTIKEIATTKSLVNEVYDKSLHKRTDNELLIAAYNAPPSVKMTADYVCDGVHDEVTIQNAVDAYMTSGKDCIRLSKGIFNIDAFPHALTTDEGTTYTAIALPNDVDNTYPEIRIYGRGASLSSRNVSANASSIYITQNAANTIVANAQYKVFGGSTFRYSYNSMCCVHMADFDIKLVDNQYPILCIDMSLVNRVKVDRIFMGASRYDKYNVNWRRPVEGCIGLRMTSGSNWGTENDYRNVYGYGFYETFQVGGESVICENLCSINAVYGYTFGNYPWQDSFNHKIVMIGIADERMENMPLFAGSGYAPSAGDSANTPFEVIMLGYSTELRPPIWSSNPINYATELYPNGYCGVITYQHEITESRANQVGIPFWADGMGKNFKTSNSSQLEVTTKAVLKTYAPNYNQIVYCTDLQKPLICTEPSTKEWRDFMGNVVDINS